MDSLSLRIGTSGWYYDEWVGPFYQKKKGMLTAYTKTFDTVEVNSTFYRYLMKAMECEVSYRFDGSGWVLGGHLTLYWANLW